MRLTLLSSSPSHDMMRICFLAHEALPSDTRHLLLPIVVIVIVAAARRDMKMPGAWVLLSSPSHDEMYMPRALALRILSSTYVVVAAVINGLCACARWLIDS